MIFSGTRGFGLLLVGARGRAVSSPRVATLAS